MKANPTTIKNAIEAAKNQIYKYKHCSTDFYYTYKQASKIEAIQAQKILIKKLESLL